VFWTRFDLGRGTLVVVFKGGSCYWWSSFRTANPWPQGRHRTLKGDCIRQQTPLSLEDAQRIVARYVQHYNEVRLHSAISYMTPKDRLEDRQQAIFDQRDRRLEAARERRK